MGVRSETKRRSSENNDQYPNGWLLYKNISQRRWWEQKKYNRCDETTCELGVWIQNVQWMQQTTWSIILERSGVTGVD